MQPDWSALVAGVRAGEEWALILLYNFLNQGPTRFTLLRAVGTEAEDLIGEIFCIVVTAIRKGDLRNPECLPGFIRTVRQRQVCKTITELIEARQTPSLNTPEAQATYGVLVDERPGPEHEAIQSERDEIVREALAKLSERDRKLLIDFYVEERPWEHVAREMGLTATQFRLGKSRAKQRFGKHGQRLLKRNRTAKAA